MVFTDVVMPAGMSGNEFAAFAMRPDLKVLLSSDYAEPTVARQKLGARAWLKKPYTATELAERIHDILRKPPA